MKYVVYSIRMERMNTTGSRYISFRYVVTVDIKRRKTRPKVIYQATGMFHISECIMRINLTTNGTNQNFFSRYVSTLS